jgi:hypothetical protein
MYIKMHTLCVNIDCSIDDQLLVDPLQTNESDNTPSQTIVETGVTTEVLINTDVPTTTEDQLCPCCYDYYPVDANWSGWVLKDGEHFCSTFCSDHIECSECSTVLGRHPWHYKITAYSDNRLCSHDCYLTYCQRMAQEYPESDEEIEVDMNEV